MLTDSFMPAGFSSRMDAISSLPSGPAKTAASSRLITGCASGPKMSPCLASLRASRTFCSKARWFLSISSGVASVGPFRQAVLDLLVHLDIALQPVVHRRQRRGVRFAERADDPFGRGGRSPAILVVSGGGLGTSRLHATRRDQDPAQDNRPHDLSSHPHTSKLRGAPALRLATTSGRSGCG